MAWTTAFGNSQRNSYVDHGTTIGGQVWIYAFPSPEIPYGPPVVSGSGYIWIITKDVAGNDFTFYLYCFNTNGTVHSKTALQVDEVIANTTGRITVTSADLCLVPWQSSLKAYDITGSLSWEFTRTTDDTSSKHFDAPAINDSGNIVLIWSHKDTGGSAQDAFVDIIDTSGNLVTEFDTGLGLLLTTTEMACVDSTGIYVTAMTYPVTGSTHVFLTKFSFAGATLWQYDVGIYTSNARILWPSVSGNVVTFYGELNGTSGYVTVFALNATTGALLWTSSGVNGANDYANFNPNPPIDADGNVYGGHLLEPFTAGTIRKLDGADGTQLWSYSLVSDPALGPTVPIIGNDGYMLWANGNIQRVGLSSGTGTSVTSGLVASLQPALANNRLYVPTGTSTPTYLAAYEVITAGGGGGGSAVCVGSHPQLWALTQTTRKITRVQQASSRDMLVGTDLTTGSAKPNWAFSTGFDRPGKSSKIKQLLADTEGGGVDLFPSKSMDTSDERRISVPIGEIHTEGAGDMASPKWRIRVEGTPEAKLRTLMWERDGLDRTR